MTAINQPPRGLQDLLGSQSFGDNPSELARVVVPGVELYPFWATDKESYLRSSNVLTGRGVAVSTTVPIGEIWIPRAISGVHSGLADTPTVIESLSIRIAALAVGGQGVTVASSTVSLVTSGSIHRFAYTPDRLLTVRAGTAIQLRVDQTESTVSETYELEIWYDKLLA